jgi:hypothetical protein
MAIDGPPVGANREAHGSNGSSTITGDAPATGYPQPESGAMDEATARGYVELTQGEFQAFEQGGRWYLYMPRPVHPSIHATTGAVESGPAVRRPQPSARPVPSHSGYRLGGRGRPVRPDGYFYDRDDS